MFSFLFYAIISAKKKTIKKEEDAMDFYEAVQRRRTVRDFAEKKVPDKVVTRILEAGLKAPTNDHLRQWEFVVLRDARSIETALGQVGENAGRVGENAGRVGAPEGYVMPCYLALGYPAEGISYPEQERIDQAKKIHLERW